MLLMDGGEKSGFFDFEPAIACARENSPYLAGLLEKWPDISLALSRRTPERIFESLRRDICPMPYVQLNTHLRRAKQQIHLLTALCDLAGVWDWEQVCRNLSDFADAAMEALIASLANEMQFGGQTDNPVPGLFVLALGKYGARELNYSSDIDLIVFYDPDRIHLPDPARAERTLVRFVRKLMRGFDEVTKDGYVFRTDLRLRPDPRATTVAVSTRTAERYYESLGQNWERAAMIKARPVGGDMETAHEFIEDVMTPFVWRRSLDFHAIDDIHSIKRQISGVVSPRQFSAPGHDVKLGFGGIREIEFFVQVQQLILGGRKENLRAPRTVDGLQALAEAGYVDPKTARILQEDYAVLRHTEHRIQMYGDEQSHIWPRTLQQRKCLTALGGGKNVEDFEHGLCRTFKRVHGFYQDLFADQEDLSTARGSLVFTGVEPEALTLATFENYGFERGPEIWQIMADWLGGRIKATRSQRARELLTRLAPRLIEACGTSGAGRAREGARDGAGDRAFFSFAEFFTNLNTGVTLLSLLLKQPSVLTALVEMLATAPSLAGRLSAKPALIDAMTDPAFFENAMVLKPDSYISMLDPDMDFETAMNAVRRAVHEDQFMFTAKILRGYDPGRAGQILTDIASAAITALLPRAQQELERVYGPLNGQFAVLGLGKLGGGEMSLKSDLDIMLVYQGERQDVYNKLTRRLITALSSVTAQGGLYEVDMALRPSGRAGPLAVSLSAFAKYYADQAWTWEYMALSRARVIAASGQAFKTKLTQDIANILMTKDFAGKLKTDILAMHERLQRDKPGFGLWDIKNTPGGLRDIEFIAQYLMLAHTAPASSQPENLPKSTVGMLQLAKSEGWLEKTLADRLIAATGLYHRLQQVLAVTVSGDFDPAQTPVSVRNLLARATGDKGFVDFTKLQRDYFEICRQVRADFVKIFAI